VILLNYLFFSAAKWILSTHSRSSPSTNKMQWNGARIQSTCLRHFRATKLRASRPLAVFTNSTYWVPEDQGGGFSFIAFVHFSTKASEEFVLPWRRSSSSASTRVFPWIASVKMVHANPRSGHDCRRGMLEARHVFVTISWSSGT